jgi:hypothetical protein
MHERGTVTTGRHVQDGVDDDECQAAGLLDPHRRPGAEIAAWSAVHGLAGLLLDGPLPTTGAEVKFSLRRVLELIGCGLLNDS